MNFDLKRVDYGRSQLGQLRTLLVVSLLVVFKTGFVTVKGRKALVAVVADVDVHVATVTRDHYVRLVFL